jgi:phenylalanine-4-hydroxylase
MFRRCFRRLGPTVEDAYGSTGSSIKGGASRSLTSFQFLVDRNRPGALADALSIMKNNQVSVSYITSRPLPYESKSPNITIFVEVGGVATSAPVAGALDELRKTHGHVQVISTYDTPWYPTVVDELDRLDQSTLAAGSDLVDDPQNPHPGFHDKEYRERRRMITEAAKTYKHGQALPSIAYTAAESATWAAVWDKLTAMHQTHACEQFNKIFGLLVETGVVRRDTPPALQDVSDFLCERSGFIIRPVTGLLTSRDFLNALAFRVFYSTQYLRHHSQPLYTPEPDLIHEIMGHAPLFADADFANFSQCIGKASLGASDADIERLARCYWYSVEFGLCRQRNGVRAYGAGLLSSFGELEYCLTSAPQLVPWDPFVAAEETFPITKYQPKYFVAESFADAQKKMLVFTDSLNKPFNLYYNETARRFSTYSKLREFVSGSS